MQAGRAPIGPDGKPINLHHMRQSRFNHLHAGKTMCDKEDKRLLSGFRLPSL